jgi:hypothetical protein
MIGVPTERFSCEAKLLSVRDPLALFTTAFHCFCGARRAVYVVETTFSGQFDSYSGHHLYLLKVPWLMELRMSGFDENDISRHV